eukprot:NODE_8745_length_503_cov_2.006608_g7678_i0.p3 GENE.NODE_8745_length_503_cov_2.006608_g7678_i0~~NODE_8745_length_503_cov_2.006608_g7678_i0.p3  ORF type:complete len:73 (+),score=16.47 NODE_8745_length_503_cov_2.006608_g7678_i0:132-350(+)
MRPAFYCKESKVLSTIQDLLSLPADDPPILIFSFLSLCDRSCFFKVSEWSCPWFCLLALLLRHCRFPAFVDE